MPERSPEGVGIAGAGRLAQAMGGALRDAGIRISCVANRTPENAYAFIREGTELVDFADIGRHASRVLIAVSDKAIEPVAERIAASPGNLRIALHTCGTFGTEPLGPLAQAGVSCASFHPLQTIRSPEDSASLRGIAFGFTGDSGALAWAREIADALQGWVLPIEADRRSVYHAGAVTASNHIAAVLDAAGEMMCSAGVPPESVWTALAPLVRTTVENSLRHGPVNSLTGPVVRGDSDTVATHVRALEGDLLGLYRAAALRALHMAAERGLDEKSVEDVRRVLQGGR